MIGTTGLQDLRVDCIVGIYPHERGRHAAGDPRHRARLRLRRGGGVRRDRRRGGLRPRRGQPGHRARRRRREFQLIETMAEETAALLLARVSAGATRCASRFASRPPCRRPRVRSCAWSAPVDERRRRSPRGRRHRRRPPAGPAPVPDAGGPRLRRRDPLPLVGGRRARARAGDRRHRRRARARSRWTWASSAQVAEAFAGHRARRGPRRSAGEQRRQLQPAGRHQRSTPAVWDATLAANLSGAYYCCYHALTLMPAGGNIINIGMAGLEGIRANVRGADYYVSKTGLLVLTRALAVGVRAAADPRQHGVARAARQLRRPAAARRDWPLGAAGPVGHARRHRAGRALPARRHATSPAPTSTSRAATGSDADDQRVRARAAVGPRRRNGSAGSRWCETARSFLYLSTFYIEHDAYGIGMLAALRRGPAPRRGGERC